MTPIDLREDVPALERTRYLNTGAASPSPRRVVDAVERCLERHEYEAPAAEGMYAAADEVLEDARETVADHIGAAPAEVALTGSTTDGINRIAGAIDWSPGDVVVRTDVEHSAGVLPWRRRVDTDGVEVRVVEHDRGRFDVDDFAAAVDDARLVVLSAVSWTHGTRLPVADVVEVAHDAGAQVLVDAVQVPGQMPLDVDEWGADFVAAAAHKWLLGPWGAGFLYVRSGAEEHLEPTRVGYRSVRHPDAEGYAFEPGARRLEVGTVSPAPYAGLAEAVDLIEDLGVGTVESRIETLTDRLKDGLGDRLLGPREFESGLVSFRVEDPEAFVERAAEADVVVRSLPTGAARASVHAFNTEGDVDALLDLL